MVTILTLMYFFNGCVFLTLAIITFLQFYKYHFKNDLYLSLFFLSISWVYPLILFIPFVPENESLLLYIQLGANVLIPFSMIFINIFVDLSLFNQRTYFSRIVIFCSGIALGLIFGSPSLHGEWRNTAYGPYFTISFDKPQETIGLIILLCIGAITALRFLILGVRIFKKEQKHQIFRITKIILLLFFSGGIISPLFAAIKRFYPYYFNGLDFMLLSLIYIFIIIIYRKH
ncbi:MAG: hypothetical protein ACTSWL_02875 [Promethearchaeota archaeon]